MRVPTGVALCRTLLQSLARWYLLVSLFPMLMLFHGWLLWVGTRMIVFCGIMLSSCIRASPSPVWGTPRNRLGTITLSDLHQRHARNG
jgi:hypothetical protein